MGFINQLITVGAHIAGMFQAATLMFEQLRWGCPNEAQKIKQQMDTQ